ncbi:hypothetical protein O6H91_15G048600 [Diphasiastrum complanatum]|uniref:Uncharacterized protein n=1 Tax=Diphasiastrum complanatum TaxID=34168 RepID=A0ACC2BI54_DIPCM|nr:hypothetical protein O6H91_15G048600 [Diphasiastrum complanatum]
MLSSDGLSICFGLPSSSMAIIWLERRMEHHHYPTNHSCKISRIFQMTCVVSLESSLRISYFNFRCLQLSNSSDFLRSHHQLGNRLIPSRRHFLCTSIHLAQASSNQARSSTKKLCCGISEHKQSNSQTSQLSFFLYFQVCRTAVNADN